MRLRLSLLRPGSVEGAHHLEVTADATTTARDLAVALAGSEEYGGSAGGTRANLTIHVVEETGRSALAPDLPLIESGLRSGATIELGPPTELTARDQRGVAALLRVVSGPDAGTEVRLPAGSSDIGRTADCDIVLTDPAISKRHARLNVGAGIDLVDLNSSNGIIVGGVRVGRVTLGPGDVAVLGDSSVTVSLLRSAATDTASSTDISFVRSPVVLARPDQRRVELPEPPRAPDRNRFPWLAMAMPLALGSVMFVMLRNNPTMSAMSLLFVGLSPILMIGNYVDQRVQGKRKHVAAVAAFDAGLEQTVTTLDEAHRTDRARLQAMHPQVSECVAAVRDLDERLWSRRPEHPEFLQVRLGTGSILAPARPDKAPHAGLPDFVARATEAYARFQQLTDAPVVADLRSVGGVGLSGRREILDGAARGLVGQVVSLHSPSDVSVVCLTSTSGRQRWSWLQWAPHTHAPSSPLGGAHLSADPGSGRVLLARLEDLVQSRLDGDRLPQPRGPLEGEETHNPPMLPAVVVVADEPSVDLSRLIGIAERGPDVGVFVVWVAGSRALLPAACRTYVDLGDGTAPSVGMVRSGQVVSDVTCESLSAEAAMRLARSLTPVVDAGAQVEDDSDLPRAVSLVATLGREAVDEPATVLARWQENGSLIRRDEAPRPIDRPVSLRALVGSGGAEPFALDLRTHGPHALVGGTTGAGKSEFLQAWVLGMAHAVSPDRLTFLFVDFKGGSAFEKLQSLPHCVGMVDDLSPHLVRRALRSLGAEIHHRMKLLKRKGAKDLQELEKTGDPECPPSLVIVVDEFAALVNAVEHVADAFVDVAQRGRSLGLHLVVATQRPAGVINNNLRANTNLRVALRMNDEHDSSDVLGTPMAAHFDPSIPGRGAATMGPGRVTMFQSAFPGAQTPSKPPTPPIEVVELDFGTGRAWKLPERPAAPSGLPTDIDRLVSTLMKASARASIPEPRKPWLKPLAAAYDLTQLRQRSDGELLLGVLDDADNQAQPPEYFYPDEEGNILIVGASGSGKSTALRSLAAASAISPRGGQTHVYALDFAGGALGSLAPLPHVGSIIPGDDEERVGRLLRWLDEVVDERSARYKSVDAATLAEYRDRAGAPDEPRILLLVDGFAPFKAEYEGSVSLLATYQLFQRLIAEGRPVGVHVALTADRPAVVPTSVSSSFPRKVVLRQSEEDAYVALGVPKDVLVPTSPPGRALQVGRPGEVQLAVLGDEPSMAGQARTLEELARDLRSRGSYRPTVIRSLDAVVAGSSMPATVAGQPTLGVADISLEPIGFRPAGAILVAGPAQSGRSSSVRWLAESLHRAFPDTPLVHLSSRRSPLAGLDLWFQTGTGDEVGPLLDKLMDPTDQTPPDDVPLVAVFVEGFPDFVGGLLESRLLQLVKQCRRNGHPLIAEGESSTWGSPWPLVMEVRNARTGLLLQPDQHDGDNLLRTSLPRLKRADLPPGRGFWVQGGTAAKVQIPVSD